MKLIRTPQPWISHRRVVITDPFLASWDVRLGVEPVISGWGAALVREMDAAVVVLVRPSSTHPRA
jgi:hypothetical protein